MTSTDESPIAPAFNAVLHDLEEGDIYHFAAIQALAPIFENWTQLIGDEHFDDFVAGNADNLAVDFEKLQELLKVLKPQILEALQEVISLKLAKPVPGA